MAKLIVKNGRLQTLGGRLITNAGGAPCCCGPGTGGNVCEIVGPGQVICLELSFSGINKNPWKKSDGCDPFSCAVGYFGPGGILAGRQEIQNLSGVNITTSPGFTSGNMHTKIVGASNNCEYTSQEFHFEEIISGERSYCLFGDLHLGNVSQNVGPGQTFNWDGDVIIPPGGSVTVQNQLECGPISGLGHMSDGGGSCVVTARVVNAGDCDANNDTYTIARQCSGVQEISVDLSTNNTDGYAVRYQGELYFLTSRQTTDDPVSGVEWVSESCDIEPEPDCSDILSHLDPRCSTVDYQDCAECVDPGVQCSDITNPFDPRCFTDDYRDCPECSSDVNCNLVTGPDDPKCDLPEWASCPQCHDGTDIDPDPRPESPNASTPGFGDRVASAIQTASLGKVKPCAGCKKRQEALNRFGERLLKRKDD